MKLTAIQGNRYALCVEPGDTIDIIFDPMGVNAVLGGSGTTRVLMIDSVNLPGGNMALSFYFDQDLLYKSKPLAGGTSGLIAMEGNNAQNLCFILSENGEIPRRTLDLEKTDLGELLDEIS